MVGAADAARMRMSLGQGAPPHRSVPRWNALSPTRFSQRSSAAPARPFKVRRQPASSGAATPRPRRRAPSRPDCDRYSSISGPPRFRHATGDRRSFPAKRRGEFAPWLASNFGSPPKAFRDEGTPRSCANDQASAGICRRTNGQSHGTVAPRRAMRVRGMSG